MNLLKMYIEQKNAGVPVSSIINHIDQLIKTNQFEGTQLVELKSIRYQFEQDLKLEKENENLVMPMNQY